MNDQDILLELKNVSYDLYNLEAENVQILDNINLIIKKNQFLGVTGRSSTGKSTLLKIIGGLIKPSSGELIYGKQNLLSTIVFEDFALFPWLNIFENINLGLQSLHLSTAQIKEKVEEMMEMMNLIHFYKLYPKEVSAGIKQKTSFARALIAEPDLLLIDEPFACLDFFTAQSLKKRFT